MTQQISNAGSVADKLADKLRQSDFGDLMDDESLNRIAKDAIERAFFQPREGGYGVERKPPLLVEMAQTQFKEAVTEGLKPIIDEITKSDEFLDALIKATILAIPSAVQSLSYSIVTTGFQQSQGNAYDALTMAVTTKLREIRDAGGFR